MSVNAAPAATGSSERLIHAESKSKRNQQFFAVCGEVIDGFGPEDNIVDLLVFLCLASGTGKDHAHTSWAAQGSAARLGIRKQTAADAIRRLAAAGRLTVLVPAGKRPTAKAWNYRLSVSDDAENRIWLPNALIEGADGETPPLRLLHQIGDIRAALLLLRCYRHLDMPGSGGVDHELVSQSWPAPRAIEGEGGFSLWLTDGCADYRGTNPDFFEPLFARGDGSEWTVFDRLFKAGLLTWKPHVRTAAGANIGSMDEATADKAMRMWIGKGKWGAPDGQMVAIRKHVAQPIILDIARPRYLPSTRPVVDWLRAEEAMKGDNRGSIAR